MEYRCQSPRFTLCRKVIAQNVIISLLAENSYYYKAKLSSKKTPLRVINGRLFLDKDDGMMDTTSIEDKGEDHNFSGLSIDQPIVIDEPPVGDGDVFNSLTSSASKFKDLTDEIGKIKFISKQPVEQKRKCK